MGNKSIRRRYVNPCSQMEVIHPLCYACSRLPVLDLKLRRLEEKDVCQGCHGNAEFSLNHLGIPSFMHTVDTWYEVSRQHRIPGKEFCHLYHQSHKPLRVNNKIGNRYEDIWSSVDTVKFDNSILSSLSSEKQALCFEYSFSVSCFAVRGMVDGWS